MSGGANDNFAAPRHDLDWTTRQQSLASDPVRSAWVSANAGSGKTHVLSQRVIRLLLSGCRPSAILCLTYTKAAASEMANRVFDRLAGWTRIDDKALAAELTELEGRRPDAARLHRARQLFARALETPGGLKIQTIHAFCEAVLHQFPLEANVAGHFEVMDDTATAQLLNETQQALLAAAGNGTGALKAALEIVLGAAGEAGLQGLFAEIAGKRQPIRRFLETADRLGGVDLVLRRALRLKPDDTTEAVLAATWPLPQHPGMGLNDYCAAAARQSAKTPKNFAEVFREADKILDPADRFAFLEPHFFKSDGSSRSLGSAVSKSMREALPEAVDWFTEVETVMKTARERMQLLKTVEFSVAAMELARRLDRDYETLKRRRGRLDFDDLVANTAALLQRDSAGPWVHYKLDRGIDHILVDEAQDTSPEQWAVIEKLAEEFFAGQSSREERRTLFAVGDEKQSIYSFQGARPELFMQTGRGVRQRAFHAERHFEALNLHLSFRSTADVLSAVDVVFDDPINRDGLQSGDDAVSHAAFRAQDPGCVDLWEMIAKDGADDHEDWKAPFDATPESAPPARLAHRVAATIGRWLAEGETIVHNGKKRPVSAGDILVLVRKRDGFVPALMRQLKRAHIPVAGADRLMLTQHIAVEDLMALGRFVLMPGDDLSLCALLKSPLFDFTEADIYRLAAERKENQSVFRRLALLADRGAAKWREAHERLTALLDHADRVPVHEFYARILGRDGGRARILARLGNEAGEVLDEFLAFALDQEMAGLPGLEAFLATLEAQSPEIKRELEQGRDEIRIMTVHASKGLEAPIVFLVDSGGKPAEHQHLPKLQELPIDQTIGALPPAIVWVPGKSVANETTRQLKSRITRAMTEEYRRLLYVGMTRAADRLVVCGYHGLNVPTYSHWHKMVAEALDGHANSSPREFSAGGETWDGCRFAVSPPDESVVSPQAVAPESTDDRPPDRLSQPLPRPERLPRPLTPSSTGLVIDPESGLTAGRSPLFHASGPVGQSMERGRIIHRLLQLLPELDQAERMMASERYLERAVPEWTRSDRDEIVTAVLSVLDDAAFAPVFAPGSRAEVSVMGTLIIGGEQRALSARLDRICVDAQTVRVVDYKTNRVPPESIAEVPPSYVTQMALYRALLQPLYPGKPVETALLFTEAPRLIALPSDTLEMALATLTTM